MAQCTYIQLTHCPSLLSKPSASIAEPCFLSQVFGITAGSVYLFGRCQNCSLSLRNMAGDGEKGRRRTAGGCCVGINNLNC